MLCRYSQVFGKFCRTTNLIVQKHSKDTKALERIFFEGGGCTGRLGDILPASK